jgi:SAM-dependent methyltransferase
MQAAVVDQQKLETFSTRAVADVAAGYTGVMVSLGHTLGLYKALAGAGPMSSKELARRSGCAERYVREWLGSQAAAGYIDYHAISATYELSAENALVLADEESPFFIPQAWNVPAAMWYDEDKALEAFRTGGGVAWGDHHGRMSCGVAAFYRNGYRACLVPQWLPALDGVVERLRAGIAVADVGCGHGHSTRLMAEAFPRSAFFGFDTHEDSIQAAIANAGPAHRPGRLEFEQASATGYRDRQYGLICFFDTLHDLGDPEAAARKALEALAPGGTVMLVEPFARDRLEDNFSVVGQLYYAASSLICCAHAIAEGGKQVLGAQAGPKRLEAIFRKAGFSHFRQAAETPFNLVFEIRR